MLSFEIFLNLLFDVLFLGIVQAIHTEDDQMHCLVDYCKLMGVNSGPRVIKSSGCPHINQIDILVHSFLDSRGPGHSRFLQVFCVNIYYYIT